MLVGYSTEIKRPDGRVEPFWLAIWDWACWKDPRHTRRTVVVVGLN